LIEGEKREVLRFPVNGWLDLKRGGRSPGKDEVRREEGGCPLLHGELRGTRGEMRISLENYPSFQDWGKFRDRKAARVVS